MKNKRDEKDCTLTTDNGIPISNDTSSLTVGEDGPVLLKDTNLIEKLASFDRENTGKSSTCKRICSLWIL